MPFDEVFGTGARVLWLASSGGHLSEARRISTQIAADPQSLWLTPETADAQGLGSMARVQWLPYVRPRAVSVPLRVAALARAIVAREHFDLCISTGAALAAFALPAVALSGVRSAYVESLARPTSPSLTGRILHASHAVELYTQFPESARGRWHYRGSILENYTSFSHTPRPIRRVFVTLGTIRPYRFDRAVNAVLRWLPDGVEVVWQLGSTTRSDLPGKVFAMMGPEDFQQQIEDADLVFTHAGVGTILACLDKGKTPILLVREKVHGEHIDNHQRGIADALAAQGLAFILGMDSTDTDAIKGASQHGVRRSR